MFLRVVDALRGKTCLIYDLAKLTTVEELRAKAASELGVADASTLRMICKGKVLDDGQTLFNYRIEDGYTVLVQAHARKDGIAEDGCEDEPNKEASVKPKKNDVDLEPGESEYFDVGQAVDVQDATDGSWNEAKIDKICKKLPAELGQAEGNADDGLVYYCRNDEFSDVIDTFPLHRVRPRAFQKVDIGALRREDVSDENHLKVRYLVNYNFNKPGELGSWFEADLDLNRSDSKTRLRAVMAAIYTCDGAAIPDCKITKLDEIYILPERLPKQKFKFSQDTVYQSRTKLDCRYCFDNASKKPSCHYCSCVICRDANDEAKLLVCEECDEQYHTYCLTPPLPEVPEDEWYCPECKNDDNEVVKTGESKKLLTQRLLNMPSATTKRRWGAGQSCDGVSKKCTIVPTNHFGPIPGVEIGTCWRYRKQASEAGVHRPLVAGIHGKPSEGAYSIVVSGGYQDDQDEGDRIVFTGSGGRDLSGNKRVAEQSKDQTLDRFNAALAVNCYSKGKTLKKTGAGAGANWQQGKPLRVIRSYKLRNKYGPAEGFRYDGIYKVVKYWEEKGRAGFKVWRYELRRDDPTPAPWTKRGKEMIRAKALDKVIEPVEGIENKYESVSTTEDNDDAVSDDDEQSGPSAKNAKRPKMASYTVPSKQMELIKKDEQNSSLWNDCLEQALNGANAFFEKLAAVFTCAICQEVVHRPVTLACSHTLCWVCVQRAKNTNFKDCPTCRQPMGADVAVNEELKVALETLMPGYAKGRGDGKESKKKSYSKK